MFKLTKPHHYASIATITFDGTTGKGAVGSVPVFTVSGLVHIECAVIQCTTDLAGASATLALGTAGSTAALAAQVTATTLDAGQLHSATKSTSVSHASVGASFCTRSNIILTVGTAAITSGVIKVIVYWKPLSPGATLTSTWPSQGLPLARRVPQVAYNSITFSSLAADTQRVVFDVTGAVLLKSLNVACVTDLTGGGDLYFGGAGTDTDGLFGAIASQVDASDILSISSGLTSASGCGGANWSGGVQPYAAIANDLSVICMGTTLSGKLEFAIEWKPLTLDGNLTPRA